MKGVIFPPGDTPSEASDSIWRELQFALHLLRQAVNPQLRLGDCLAEWDGIARMLADPPRKRRLQLDLINDFIEF
jgi:hypothetical protein